MKSVMKRAGAGVPSANRITLLRDADGDGVAETRSVFLQGLNSPFGMALVGDDALRRQRRRAGARTVCHGRRRAIDVAPAKVADLPGGPINHHWTKNVIASRDGTRLYVDRRLQQQRRRERHGQRGRSRRDPGSRSARRQLSACSPPACAIPTAWPGSRRPARCGRSSTSATRLGSDLVPDYLTSVRDGGFYGWPYSYYGHHVDARVEPPRPDLVAKAIEPDYALGSHVAPLGLAFYRGRAAADRATPAAPSSACTARGTAVRAAATRWSSCRSRAASPAACPRTS